MTKELTKKAQSPRTIRELIESADVQEQLIRGVASHVKVDQLSRVWFTTVRGNAKLLNCTQHSLLSCLFAFGQLGLSPEPFLGQAYMVPFEKRKGSGIFEANFMPGYRGLVTLWRRAGDGYNLAAKAVYDGDEFSFDYIQWELQNYHTFKHTPCEDGKKRGGLRGAWAIFHYKDGNPMFDYMPRIDIDKRREASKAKNSGPWVNWPEEMAVKSVIKHGLKLAPASVEDNTIARAAYAEDLALQGEDQSRLFMPDGDDRIIDVKFRNWKEEFDEEFADLEEDPDLAAYMLELSKAHKVALVEVEKGAVEDSEGFRDTFAKWKAKKKPEKKEDKPTGKKREGVSKGKTKKPPAKGTQKPIDGENLDDLMKTEAWAIMSDLKKDDEDLYARITGGKDPRTEKEINGIIDQMNAELEGGGIPDA